MNFGSSLLSTSCPAQRAKIKWVNADRTSEQLESLLFLHLNASLQGHWLGAQVEFLPLCQARQDITL